MIHSPQRSDELSNLLLKTPNNPAWISIKVNNQETAKAMAHVLTHIYWSRMSIEIKDLVPLWSIVETLKISGDLGDKLKCNITDNLNFQTCILFFLQAFALYRDKLCHHFTNVIYKSFINENVDPYYNGREYSYSQNIISPSDWISIPPTPQFAYF